MIKTIRLTFAGMRAFVRFHIKTVQVWARLFEALLWALESAEEWWVAE